MAEYTVIDDAEIGIYLDSGESLDFAFTIDRDYDPLTRIISCQINTNVSDIYDYEEFTNSIGRALKSFFMATGRMRAGDLIVMSIACDPKIFIPPYGRFHAHWDDGWTFYSDIFLTFDKY